MPMRTVEWIRARIETLWTSGRCRHVVVVMLLRACKHAVLNPMDLCYLSRMEDRR